MVHIFGIPVASVTRFRPVVCVAAILLHAFCSAPAVQAYCAYVTNIRSGNVSVIDTAKREVVDTITVDTHPAGVVVTPDGRSAYVANNDADPGDYHVCVIDTYKNIMTTTIPVGSPGNPPFGVALTPDGGSAYVTIPRGNAVSVIDTAKNQVTATVSVGVGPFGVAVTPDGRFAYVANGQGLLTSTPGNVSVIDTAIALTDPEHAVVTTIPVGNTPLGVAITPDGRFAYVANGQDLQTPTPGDVSVIDTAKALTDPGHAVVATMLVGNNPIGVAITPDGRWVYVANGQGLGGTSPSTGDVSVIDTNDNAVDTIQVGNNPFGVAITPDGRFAYVANSQGIAGTSAPAVPGDVSVIDTGTHAVVATIPVGNNPVGIAFASVPGICPETPSPTATPTTPPPTSTPTATWGTPGSCVGDCSGNGTVSVDEILTMVNIALGNVPITECLAGDANGDHHITVDEILNAVSNALNGCVASTNVAGHWDFYHTSQGAPEEGPDYMDITQSGSTLTATFVCYGSEPPWRGAVSGNTVSLSSSTASCTGTVSGDTIAGSCAAGTWRAVRGQQPTAKQCAVATTHAFCTRFQNDQYWVQAAIRDPDGLISSATISGSHISGTSPLTKDLYPERPDEWWTDPNILVSTGVPPTFPLNYVVHITFKDATTTDVPRTVVSWEWAE